MPAGDGQKRFLVSDIGLDIPWWAIVLFVLWAAFLPLTAAAAGTGIWAFRKRTSHAARILAFVFGGLWLVSAVANVYVLYARATAK